LGHFESTTATPEALNLYVEHDDRFASHKNHPPIGFGSYTSEITPTAHDFTHFHDILGVSQVDCSQSYRMATVETVTPGVSGYVDNCGIDDIAPADYEGMKATAVVHRGIFENPFAAEWTEAEPESLAQTAIIDHVMHLCDFPTALVMVKYIDQQLWSTYSQIITVGFDEVDEFYTVRDDGITVEVTP
jgi:hypothetical protein